MGWHVTIANGPSLPPDPWDGNVMIANGPSLPPDPWDGNVMIANGPSLPPDPWDGNVMIANGPSLHPIRGTAIFRSRLNESVRIQRHREARPA